MAEAPIFQACIVCDAIRQEINHKAIILGLFGVAVVNNPASIEIKVANPKLPVAELSFLFISRRLMPGNYRIGFSLKDPSGVILFPMQEREAVITKQETLSLGFVFRPFNLTGEGTYEIFLLVNDRLDFKSSFIVSQAGSGELEE